MTEAEAFKIDEIARILKIRKKADNPTTLLLCSRTGGLFRSEHFYEALEMVGNRDFSKLSYFERFKECYDILKKGNLSPTDIHGILRISLNNLPITQADIYLAEMVKQGYFEEIISTNIDDTLENALLSAKMREQREFEVFIPGSAAFQEEKSSSCRITKICGGFVSRDYNVIKRFSYLSEPKNVELAKFSHRILAKDILIIGFDPFWDSGLHPFMPEGSGATVWFVNEEDMSENQLLSSFLGNRKVTYVTGENGNYDNFIKKLYEHLHDIPVTLQIERAYDARQQDILSQLEKLHSDQQIILSQLEKIHDEIARLRQSAPD